jgi:hypothetical protein
MASVVGICNRALQRLGAVRITDLSDDSRAARECSVAYEPVRDALLRKHAWNFAIGRAQLSASTDTPAFDYDYQYPLPTDFLRLLPPKDQNDWQIEGRNILTNDATPLNIRYVRQITDPNLMDPLFREVLACALAAEVCEAITQSNQKLQLIEQELKDKLAEARRTNAFESISADLPDDDWITARY